MLQPLSDPLIERCLAARSSCHSKRSFMDRVDQFLAEGLSETEFVPTSCLALLDALHTAHPNHTLIAADFDALPDTRISGRNAPLVASTVRLDLTSCSPSLSHVS